MKLSLFLAGLMTAAGFVLAGRAARKIALGRSPEDLSPAERRALTRAVKAVGGWNAARACRKYLGPRPPGTWRNVDRVAKQVAPDLDHLDPSSQALRDTFCKKLELRGRCPSGRQSWYKALRLALGHGGNRSYTSLPSRPAWRALAEAYREETGQDLPLPAGALKVAAYAESFERCRDEHAQKIAALVEPPPF